MGSTAFYLVVLVGESLPMPVVTMSEMVAALRATVGKRGMSEEDLRALADYLMSFFGFETEAIDNNLDVADRDVFYMLEEEGLLTTRQEEVMIKKGKIWRIHYWILRAERIRRSRNPAGSSPKPPPCTTTCPTTSGTVKSRRDRLKYIRRFVRSLAWWISSRS